MKPIRLTSAVLSLLLAWFAHGGSAGLQALELGATHLVFEKAAKMKKVETTLFMPVLDQSIPGDEIDRGRTLRCTVSAMGKKGVVTVKGSVILALRGATASAVPWQGDSLRANLDERGDVVFDAGSMADLVDEALASDVRPDLFEIRFDGGKGPKVTQVTVDCLHEPVE